MSLAPQCWSWVRPIPHFFLPLLICLYGCFHSSVSVDWLLCMEDSGARLEGIESEQQAIPATSTWPWLMAPQWWGPTHGPQGLQLGQVTWPSLGSHNSAPTFTPQARGCASFHCVASPAPACPGLSSKGHQSSTSIISSI